MLADLKVVERHAHGMLVPYVPPGQDATISSNNIDFKFQNTTTHPVLIWADTKKNTLYMAVYGRSKPPKVVWHHRISNRQKNITVYRNNPALRQGTQRVAVPGAEGMTVESWVTIEKANGKTITRKLGIDHYRPMPRVIERGVSTIVPPPKTSSPR
ncbi:MAG: VanW family protein [Bacillota bacterium]